MTTQARGIKRKIKASLDAVNKEIAVNAGSGGLYARGLSGEGYAGGYAAALRDVLSALDGYDQPGRYWRVEGKGERLK